MGQPSAIRLFTISSSAYTPIVTPIDCNYYMIVQNVDGSALVRSSDGTDANSYTMGAGTWYSMTSSIAAPVGSKSPMGPRYPAGSVVTYIKSKTGTGPVVVEFVL